MVGLEKGTVLAAGWVFAGLEKSIRKALGFLFMEAPRQAASRAEARTGKIKEDSNLREWDRVKVQIPRLLSIGWPGDDVARQ